MNNNSFEPIRDARALGKPKMLILGLQHMFAMFGATILVPILVAGYFSKACGEEITRGLTVAVSLFCSGMGTLIFHICSKMKVPAYLGSSFAYLGGFYTVANLNRGIYADMAANDKVAYACGDYKSRRCKPCYEIFAAGCYRPDDNLHRSFTCAVCDFKRIGKLGFGSYCPWCYNYFQHLG